MSKVQHLEEAKQRKKKKRRVGEGGPQMMMMMDWRISTEEKKKKGGGTSSESEIEQRKVMVRQGMFGFCCKSRSVCCQKKENVDAVSPCAMCPLQN